MPKKSTTKKTPKGPSVSDLQKESKDLIKKRKALAAEYYDAIQANNPEKVESLAKKIDAENRTGRGAKVPISTRSVNAAFASVKGTKVELRRALEANKNLIGGCWGMTRRRRGTRSTRKNGFLGF